MHRVTAYDCLLAGAILGVSGLGVVLSGGTRGATGPCAAVVSVEGRAVERLDLTCDRVVAVPGVEGVSVEVKAGSVGIRHANCARQLCRNGGAIHSPGQTIVCVPNKLVITVEGPSTSRDYDAESY